MFCRSRSITFFWSSQLPALPWLPLLFVRTRLLLANVGVEQRVNPNNAKLKIPLRMCKSSREHRPASLVQAPERDIGPPTYLVASFIIISKLELNGKRSDRLDHKSHLAMVIAQVIDEHFALKH